MHLLMEDTEYFAKNRQVLCLWNNQVSTRGICVISSFSFLLFLELRLLCQWRHSVHNKDKYLLTESEGKQSWDRHEKKRGRTKQFCSEEEKWEDLWRRRRQGWWNKQVRRERSTGLWRVGGELAGRKWGHRQDGGLCCTFTKTHLCLQLPVKSRSQRWVGLWMC